MKQEELELASHPRDPTAPSGWRTVQLEELFQVLDRLRVPVNAKERATRQGNIPYYGATGQVGWIDDHLFDEELILVGEDGAPFLDPSKSKAYVVSGKTWVNNHAHVLRALGNTPSRFWKYQLDQVDYTGFVSGTTRLKLSQGPMRRIPLAVPPCEEQQRIVRALDAYTTRLDAAVATLGRAKKNLTRYRASVLAAAVEGRLVPTEAALAREEGREYEPASALLDRILAERRRRWEAAELAKMEARGKPPKKDRWKRKYKPPAEPDVEGLPELPEGWCWTTLDALNIDGPYNGLYVPKSVYGRGVPILRIDDYQMDQSRSAVQFRRVDIDTELKDKYSLSIGDLVVNRVNSPSHLGKTLAVSARHIPAVFESNMMRLTPSDHVSAAFLQAYLSSSSGHLALTANAKWAVNQASINQQDVKLTPVPLPPQREQDRITEEIARLLSVQRALVTTSETNIKRCARIRQSILKWAFEGKLVDPDPDDEPAEALLARIRAERAAARPRKKTRRRKKKPAP